MNNFDNVEELSAYIAEKLDGEYDYNSHVQAIADIALAAFNFAASKLGASGFSASCAELEFLRKSRKIDGPFAVLNSEIMLYPQYDLRDMSDKYYHEWLPWASAKAKELLSSERKDMMSPQVFAWWQYLASINPDQ